MQSSANPYLPSEEKFVLPWLDHLSVSSSYEECLRSWASFVEAPALKIAKFVVQGLLQNCSHLELIVCDIHLNGFLPSTLSL